MSKQYSFQLFEYDSALDEHQGCLATKPPTKRDLCITNFADSTAQYFHTSSENGKLCISTNPKVLGLIIDESGSCTWNDQTGDRITLYKNMLNILDITYPGSIYVNLLGFGGTLVKCETFVLEADSVPSRQPSINQLKTQVFSDSVYDLKGVIIVRKKTGFPVHPTDGIIVADGILENVKDADLEKDTTYYYKIFTYNKNDHFSSGVPISFSTHNRILPKGVVSFNALPRILPGARRDENTSLILNFVEGSGTVLYDSSGNSNHTSLIGGLDENQFWKGASTSSVTSEFKTYYGGRFDGVGYLETMSSSQDFVTTNTNNITINLWIYHHDSGNEEILLSSENNANFQYQIRLDTNGRIRVLSIGATVDITSSGIVTTEEWSMITIVFMNSGNLQTQIYINGLFDSSITTVYPANIADAVVRIGGSLHAANFHGAISNVSCHTTSRNSTYISSLYAQESRIFFSEIANNVREPVDNGQREVLIEWVVPEDFDYENGEIKIIKKYNEVPSHIDDGIELTTESASVGTFAFLDTGTLVNGASYFYRLYTINSLNNACHFLDARIAPVYIPISPVESPDPPLQQANATAVPGNQKVKISWDTLTDARVEGVRIFYNTGDFPVINKENSAPIPWNSGSRPFYSGEFIVDTTKTFFIHRTIGFADEDNPIPLQNETVYYYTVVTYDENGDISEPVHLQAIPSEDYEDVVFSPDDVKQVWAELVNEKTISLHWINPSADKMTYIALWFDQVAIFYLQVIDIYGDPVNGLSNFDFIVSKEVFPRRGGESSAGSRPDQEHIIRIASEESGIIKGYLSHIQDREILSNTDYYRFFLTPKYQIVKVDSTSPVFTYTLPNLGIIFTNPLQMSMENLLGKTVKSTGTDLGALVDTSYSGRPCMERFCTGEAENDYTDKEINGGYIFSHEPYICRVFVSYRRKPVPEGTPVEINLYKSGTTIPAEYASIRTGEYLTITQEIEWLGLHGRPTGNYAWRSFVDVPMDAPSYPELVDIHAKFTHNGIWVEGRHPVLWASTLKMEVETHAPIEDGIDISEQFCHIYFVDPDDPDSVEKRTPIRNNVLVKWEITKGEFYKERPFYSLDSISERISGVYSRTSNGDARNVWFGPISNIENHTVNWDCGSGNNGTCCIGEEYLITAQIIENNEIIKAGKWLSYTCDSRTTDYRILLDGNYDQPRDPPHFFGYADGESLIHLQIASDPATSDLPFAPCFRDCLEAIGIPLVPLPCDQIINLDVGGLDPKLIEENRLNEAGIEVIWNAQFDEDPYTGERTLLPGYSSLKPTISAKLQTEHVAHIPITGEITDIYLRLNRFVGELGPEPCEDTNAEAGTSSCSMEPVCECMYDMWKWEKVQLISCTSTMIQNNRVVTLTGGGSYTVGIPPVYVGFKEPLRVQIVDIRINGIGGQKVADVVVDGITKHTFVVEVLFSGKTVPDGTLIQLSVSENAANGKADIIVLSSPIIYTHLTHDPLFDPLQQSDSRSLAYFEIEPLPDVNFNVKINATSTYDKSGEVPRSVSGSITIENSVDKPSDGEPAPPETEHDPNKMTPISNEIIVYDTLIDSYFDLTGMQEPRMGHFSSAFGIIAETTGALFPYAVETDTAEEAEEITALYMIGGYNGDKPLSSVEIYDFETRIVRFSSIMPTPRAFGQSATISDKIYCIGGLEYDILIERFVVSRKVEYFDVITETWNPALSDMPENYGVAFGCAVVHESDIYILCGCNSINAAYGAGKLNDKILKYDTINDVWTTFDVPTDFLNLYRRISPFTFTADNSIYAYGGTIPKDSSYLLAEIQARTAFELSKFDAYIFASSYYSQMATDIFGEFVESEKSRIILQQKQSVSYFHFPSIGFIYSINSGSFDKIDEQWPQSPSLRDRGQAVYYSKNNSAYFIGGSGSSSTTLNKNETINLDTNSYEEKTPLPRGRNYFRADLIDRYIYITGGLTSGHQEGWVFIDALSLPNLVEATGNQTSGLLLTLRNDSGEIINENLDVLIRGYLNIPGITDAYLSLAVTNALERLSGSSAEGIRSYLNDITNFHSDDFQFDAAKLIEENISLFPVLLTQDEFIVRQTGSSLLLPRSEDPFSNLQSLANALIQSREYILDNVRESSTGTSTADRLAALERILGSITDQPVSIFSGTTRDLYGIELQITVLDETYFGQTICISELESLRELYKESGVATDIPDWITLRQDSKNSGQSTMSQHLFPVNPVPKMQSICPSIKYFNYKDWIPQLKEYLMNNNSTPSEAISQLDIIDDHVPFGSSQLFDALVKMSEILSDENIIDIDKNIYVNSDHVENLSVYPLSRTIEEINSIDGEKKVPVIYTVFSTSFPSTISSQLARSQSGTAEALAEATGGHSTVLALSSFLPQIVNFILSVSGALGYGIYRKVVDFGAICSITKLTTSFEIYSNTNGYIRYRSSLDGRTYSAWTKKYDANSSIDISDLETRYIEFEITLETGFDTDPDDPYIEPTGIPCAISVCWEYSVSKEDFLLLNVEASNGNAQQVETVVTGSIPVAAEIKTGAAPSDAIQWEEFQTEQRPSLNESQKTFLLDRQLDTDEKNSVVKKEVLTTKDGLIFTSQYGAWSETASIVVYEENEEGIDVVIASSLYVAHPRNGQIIMTTKYPTIKTFKMTVHNEDKLKVGLQLINSNHEETICVEGAGFMWSTNRIKPPALSQAPPRAINVMISPSNPYISSTIIVSYHYVDINRDEESGSLIRWYKNGTPLLEINDKVSFVNSDLLPSNRMKPNDILKVGITPSDEVDYGSTYYSSEVRVAAAPPETATSQLVATRNGNINDRFDTGSVISVKYDFSSPDTGEAEDEVGTEISWYVNGELYKTVFYNTTDGDGSIKKSLFPFNKVTGKDAEGKDIVINDITVYTIGNQVYAEVIARSSALSSDPVRTQSITIVNSVPIAKNVMIVPTTPNMNSVLTINVEIDDPDITLFASQTDSTEYHWYKSTDSINFIEVIEVQNKKMVSPSYTTSGEWWKCQVIPFDGIEFGEIKTTPTVIILSV